MVLIYFHILKNVCVIEMMASELYTWDGIVNAWPSAFMAICTGFDC